MKARHAFVAVVAFLLFAACGEAGKGPTAGPSNPSESPHLPSPTLVRDVHSIVHAAYRLDVEKQQADLWLYDVINDKKRRLTFDDEDRVEILPRFRTSDRITFFDRNERSFVAKNVARVYEVDGGGGTPKEIARLEEVRIDGYDWSPDGTVFAYLSHGEGEGHGVKLYDPAAATEQLIRRLPPSGDRHVFEDNEIRVEWSPDGTAILVSDSLIGSDQPSSAPHVFVFRPDGTDLVEPFQGTMARWTAGGQEILARELGGAQRWFTVDVRSGQRRYLAMTPDTVRAAPSPDGRFIAHDKGGEHPRLLLYDRATQQERVLRENAAGAIWLSPTSLAASQTEPCPPMPCGDVSWRVKGQALRIDTSSGTAEPLGLRSTIGFGFLVDVDVLALA